MNEYGPYVDSTHFQELLETVLSNDPSVTKLFLSDKWLGDQGLEAVANALQDNSTVQSLVLRRNEITPRGILVLCTVLRYNKSIHTIFLRGNSIGNEGCRWLGNILLKENTTLVTLDLQKNCIGDTGATYLGEGLQNNYTLKHLKLENNKIGNVGAKAFGQYFINRKHPQRRQEEEEEDTTDIKRTTEMIMEELALSKNSIKDDGAVAIAQGIVESDCLQDLHLDRNQIGDDGIEHIAEMLVKTRQLKKLQLKYNSFTLKGAKRLLEGVERNYFIESVCIDQHYGDIQRKMDFYLLLNKVGHRHILRNDDNTIPTALWANILAKIGNYFVLAQVGNGCIYSEDESAGMLYYFLQCKPDLFRDVSGY
mmetsp:Transcript_27631/g.38870  ORF Transcript_27631/g.38870 Transcript_27631/m.38870 type:complete len:366 (-) Transcript_27631:215-1312(-)